MSKTWTNMTASDLGRAIGKGTINPVELTEFFLDTIASHPLSPRIYARTTAPRALPRVSAAGRRRAALGKRRLGPAHQPDQQRVNNAKQPGIVKTSDGFLPGQNLDLHGQNQQIQTHRPLQKNQPETYRYAVGCIFPAPL